MFVSNPYPSLTDLLNSLDGASHKLSEVTGNDPKSQVFSPSAGRSKRHDGSRFCHVPTPGADSANETTENEILWETHLLVEVIPKYRRPGNGFRVEAHLGGGYEPIACRTCCCSSKPNR